MVNEKLKTPFDEHLKAALTVDILHHFYACIMVPPVYSFESGMVVAYFDQWDGAPHAVPWSKSFVSAWKQVFPSFSVTNKKKKEKRKERKAQKVTRKTFITSNDYIAGNGSF